MKTDLELMFQTAIIALGAGEEVMRYYGKADVQLKADQTPVTQADMQSHAFLCTELVKILNVPVCSEEGTIPYESRKDLDAFWLIDPLDGTKDFIDSSDGFSICIALIRANMPVIGVVFAPAFKLLYAASKGCGAYAWGAR